MLPAHFFPHPGKITEILAEAAPILGGPRLFVVISADGKKKYNILLRMPGYKIPPDGGKRTRRVLAKGLT